MDLEKNIWMGNNQTRTQTWTWNLELFLVINIGTMKISAKS